MKTPVSAPQNRPRCRRWRTKARDSAQVPGLAPPQQLAQQARPACDQEHTRDHGQAPAAPSQLRLSPSTKTAATETQQRPTAARQRVDHGQVRHRIAMQQTAEVQHMDGRTDRQHRPLHPAPGGHALHAGPGHHRRPDQADQDGAHQYELIATAAAALGNQVPAGVAEGGGKNQGEGKRLIRKARQTAYKCDLRACAPQAETSDCAFR